MEYSNALATYLGALVDGAPGGAMTWILGLAFMAVLFAALGVAGLFASDTLARRLASGVAPRGTAPDHGQAEPLRERAGEGGHWGGLIKPLEPYLGGRGAGATSSLRVGLAQAGFATPGALRAYLILRVVSAVLVPLVFVLSAPLWGGRMAAGQTLYYAAALACAAVYLPGRWVSRRAERHREAIRASFPDALDLMVVCVEAGLGLDAALNRVGREIAPAHPILGAELALVALELRAGKSRDAALRNFARRVGVSEITSFATLLIQSDALGSSVAQTLRVQAEEMRAGRMLRAEEMAHTLPVKLTIPLVICVLPAMIAVVLLPSAITIVRDILPNLGH